MSVAELEVDVLSATLHLPAGVPAGGPGEVLDGEGARRWLVRLQSGLADTGLAKAFAAADLPPGRWYLRRVDLPVRLDLGRPEIALVAEWAEHLAAAVRRTALAGGPLVVHYRDGEAAVRDVVRGVVAGIHERAWAWTSAGVLRADDPDPVVRPRDALLAVAARQPRPVLPAVLELLRRPGGLAALDRVLGPAGWVRLVLLLVTEAMPEAPAAEPVPRGWMAPPEPDGPREDRRVRTLAERIVATSAVAGRMHRTPLRPGPAALRAWALLVLADADPGSLRAPGAARLVAEIAARLTPARASATAPDRPDPAAAAPEPQATAGRAADPAAFHGEGTEPSAGGGPPAPGPPPDAAGPADRREAREDAEAEDEPGWPTQWAGLSFLLAAADDAGLPATALDDPLLAGRPLRWVLFMLAGLVAPVAADDPARLLVAGLTPDRADVVTREPPPDEDEAARLAELVAAWSHAVAARLAAAGAEHPERPDGSAVVAMARRPGVVTGGPGWLEVLMPMSCVELAIRRAGLDLDPGWVPWLGAVVRYRYE
jgi:hypothetical protein